MWLNFFAQKLSRPPRKHKCHTTFLSGRAKESSFGLYSIERATDHALRHRPHVHNIAGLDGGLGVPRVRRPAGLRVPASGLGADQGNLREDQGVHAGGNGE